MEKKSFKTTKLDTKLSDYIQNSLKLEEFLEFAMFIPDGSVPTTKDISGQIRSFYTVYFGTCYMLDAKVMVSFKLLIHIANCPLKISKNSLFPLSHI